MPVSSKTKLWASVLMIFLLGVAVGTMGTGLIVRHRILGLLAGALTFFFAHGLSVAEACRRAGPFGAAVLRGVDPLPNQLALAAP